MSYLQSVIEDTEPFQPGKPVQHGIETDKKTTKDLKREDRGEWGVKCSCEKQFHYNVNSTHYYYSHSYLSVAPHHHEDKGERNEDVSHGKWRYTRWGEEGQTDSCQTDQRQGQGEQKESHKGRLQPWKNDGHMSTVRKISLHKTRA